jgi:hypothetical protein
MEPEDDYTLEELETAFLADEAARSMQDNRDLFAFSNPRKVSYGMVPDREVEAADLDANDVDAAIFELSREHGIDAADVLDMVDQLAAGERDPQTRAMAVLKLASMDEDAALELAVSAEARQKYAKSGVAMGSGAYPIPDSSHLAYAKQQFKAGHLTGHSAEEVRKHINARARALGLPGLDEDDDEDEGKPTHVKRSVRATKAAQQLASQGSAEGVAPYASAGEGGAGPTGEASGTGMAATRALVRDRAGHYQTIALTEPLSPVEQIMASNPAYFANTDPKFYNPAAVGGPFDPYPGPAKFGNLPKVHDTGSRGDSPGDEDSTDVDRKIAKLIHDHPGEFGAEKLRGGWSGMNTVHRPKSVAARNAAEARESTKPQNPIQR